MTISLRLNSSNHCAYFSVSDSFQFADFHNSWREFLIQCPGRACRGMIWDLSAMDTSSVLESDLHRIAEFMVGQIQLAGSSLSVALVAPTKATHDMANSYLNLLLDGSEFFSVFNTLAAAEQWLKEQQSTTST